MRIPTAPQFGNAEIATPNTSLAGADAVSARGTEIIGNTLQHIGAQEDQRLGDLAKAKAANAMTQHQLAINSTLDDIKTKVATGELPWDQAQKAYQDSVQKLKPPQINHLDQAGQLNYAKGLELNTVQGGQIVKNISDAGQKIEFQDQFASALDGLGKLAGAPNADIEAINKQADAWRTMAQSAQIPKNVVDKTLQDFKDHNWYNQAVQRSMTSRDSLPGLQQLEHDLTAGDGFYANRLDTDKRNAVLNQVITHRQQLENKIQVQADRRDAKAERALVQIDQQIASGVPATAEMWSDWGNTIKGTSYADQFKERVVNETEVQNVLRQPIADQIKFVQDKEAALTSEGGSIQEATNVARLKTAVQRNITLMQQQPLVFNANRTGQDVEPLDVQGLLTGDAGVSHQIADRMATIKAMQKQYGTQVPSHPLLPQETQLITGMLDKATPDQQSQIFAGLFNAVGDTKAYMGVMQQIAPDSPVKAIAGMLAAKQKTMPLETHWFSPNVIGNSGDISATMLQGMELLSPTKSASGQDGKPKVGLYLPESNTLQADFQNTIGTAFAGRPSAAENAFQAVKAYYVGRAAQTGRVAADNKDIDTKLVKESIRATLGDVVDYNGKGEVLAPWGMDSSTFEDRVHSALITEGTKRGLPADAVKAMRNVGLRNLGDGTYYVTQGKSFVTDPQGHPLVIDVTK